MNIPIELVYGIAFFIIVLIYIIINILKKLIKIEKIVDSYDIFLNQLNGLIIESNKIFNDNKISEGFRNDDEVGGFFIIMKEIQDKLLDFITK